MSVINEDWNYRLEDIKTGSNKEFESRVSCLHDEVLQFYGFRARSNLNMDMPQSLDEELKALIEKNKQLRCEIDKKLEELNKQKSHYENYKQDQKLLSQEVKDTHEAFLMAKKYYKRYLKLYYTIESRENDKETIFIQFFTEAKKDSDNFSVKMIRDIKTDHYELIKSTPKLKTFDELKKTLSASNNVPSVLYSIRQSFLKIKKSKKS